MNDSLVVTTENGNVLVNGMMLGTVEYVKESLKIEASMNVEMWAENLEDEFDLDIPPSQLEEALNSTLK